MTRIEQRHLTKGDAEPGPLSGKLRLYGSRFCPFVHRAVLVLEKKNISYEIVNINTQVKPEWFAKISPSGKVPVLQLEDGRLLDESLIIAEYLDEKYPTNPLYPRDPYAKAIDKIFIDRFGAEVFKPLGAMLMNPDNINEERWEELLKALQLLEKELVVRNTTFLAGSQPGMVDLMIWPIIERVGIPVAAKPDICKLPQVRLPKLLQWRDTMLQDEAIKQRYLPGDVYLKVNGSNGEKLFDILVK